MKTIRLAIVRQTYRPDGGAERFISRALQALDNSELELNIITRQWAGELHPNWRVHICNPRGNSRVARARGFTEAARQYWQQNDFDLVQSHERIAGCDIFRAGDGVHMAWLEQRKRIIAPHQRWLIPFNKYHRYMLSMERDIFYSPRLKKIICNSAMVRDDIIHYYGVAQNKFALIYNAIDSQRFTTASSVQRRTARDALSIPAQACTLIFVGSGFARKGLQQTLHAVSTTNHYLIIVGKDKHQRRYKNLAKSLGCLSRVRFAGVRQDVLPYYHAADALILPTLYDPFPNVILEAMSCGLPVITSHRCGGAEFINQGCEGFICDALDIASLRAFAHAIPSRERDPTMGIAARQKVSTCTPANLSRQLIGLYQQLLS
ncbi:glycosyltransferase family 4 protein [Sodalis endosymbiont of Henestaris halophilus]|uniref:glycosyltransferase family 4 protein n=1 Tax=Sodalis endosymbiont of Henestaris halophilus TaxID=1929246 RepID=UPI000BC06E78|nr:glycosyltransferase family 4 protein [Sodalis endosymbiont of Henestaris halophilus]SNC58538.1 Lipopolysaccharide core biosynthesis protein RfaG [Sodalis endosymbiont of Henestaris halophilus]